VCCHGLQKPPPVALTRPGRTPLVPHQSALARLPGSDGSRSAATGRHADLPAVLSVPREPHSPRESRPARPCCPASAREVPRCSSVGVPVPYAGCEHPARATAHDRSDGHALRTRSAAPRPPSPPTPASPRTRNPPVTAIEKDRGIFGSPGSFCTLSGTKLSVGARSSTRTGRPGPPDARPDQARHTPRIAASSHRTTSKATMDPPPAPDQRTPQQQRTIVLVAGPGPGPGPTAAGSGANVTSLPRP
jgi:hypothetical protein